MPTHIHMPSNTHPRKYSQRCICAHTDTTKTHIHTHSCCIVYTPAHILCICAHTDTHNAIQHTHTHTHSHSRGAHCAVVHTVAAQLSEGRNQGIIQKHVLY